MRAVLRSDGLTRLGCPGVRLRCLRSTTLVTPLPQPPAELSGNGSKAVGSGISKAVGSGISPNSARLQGKGPHMRLGSAGSIGNA